ncbi:MAG TPA: histidine kinase [Chloroflexota bacterium]
MTPHPLAERIHDRVLQLLGSAMLQSEMAEQLHKLGRYDDVPPTLVELRSSLDQAVVELRGIMAELRDESLKNPAV